MTTPYAGQVQQVEHVPSEAYLGSPGSAVIEHRMPVLSGAVGSDEVADVCPICQRQLPHLFAPCSSWQEH